MVTHPGTPGGDRRIRPLNLPKPVGVSVDPEGRPLARIELPTRLMPLDARGDRLLAYEQDELEIEYVRLYPLTPAAAEDP